MMNPQQLFARRLRRYATEQYQVWRSALDWTVLLYLLVPAILIGGGTYREIWLSPPSWLLELSWWWYPVVLLLPLILGRLRTFQEEADILFLAQQQHWLRRIVGLGMIYTIVVQSITVLLLHLLMLPYLVQGLGLTWETLLICAGWTVALRLLCTLAVNLADGRWTGWRRYTVDALLLLALLPLYVYGMRQWMSQPVWAGLLGIAAVAVVLVWLIRRKLASRSSLFADIASERDARLASTELLLSQASPPKRIGRLKQPLVLRRSQRLFRRSDAGTMLAELYIKSVLRQFGYVRLNLGFFSVSITAVVLTPLWLGLALLVVLPLMAGSWQRAQWKHWFDEEFVRHFRWTDEQAAQALETSKFWLLLPGVLVLGLIAGFSLIGWWGGPLTMVGAGLVWRLTSKLPF